MYTNLNPYVCRKERSQILEKSRRNMEKILERRREIEKRREEEMYTSKLPEEELDKENSDNKIHNCRNNTFVEGYESEGIIILVDNMEVN
jgi:hypothetical protein